MDETKEYDKKYRTDKTLYTAVRFFGYFVAGYGLYALFFNWRGVFFAIGGVLLALVFNSGKADIEYYERKRYGDGRNPS